MKIYQLLLIICLTVFLSSCILKPNPEKTYLCSINADGTGFQRIISVHNLPFDYSTLWDLYVTKDDRVIYAADKYYVENQDSLNWSSFSDNTAIEPRRLTFSNDNKAYFCENGELYEYDLGINTQRKLTSNTNINHLLNPNISSDENTIMLLRYVPIFSSWGILNFTIGDDSLHLFQYGLGNVFNIAYNPQDSKIYYENYYGLNKINFDGSNDIQLVSYQGYINTTNRSFGLTMQNDHIVCVDRSNLLRIFNTNTNNTDFSQQLEEDQNLVKIPKQANRIFYLLGGSIYYYDLINQIPVKVLNTEGIEGKICPDWGGNKIYYFSKEEPN